MRGPNDPREWAHRLFDEDEMDGSAPGSWSEDMGGLVYWLREIALQLRLMNEIGPYLDEYAVGESNRLPHFHNEAKPHNQQESK